MNNARIVEGGGGGGPFAATSPRLLPMKPGEPLTALKIFKNQDPPVVLKRSEYPDWVNTLAEKDVSLAQLRKMDVSDATDKEQMRFLKLTRRVEIRSKNEASKAK
jgi:Mitochondrial ribosomal protein L37